MGIGWLFNVLFFSHKLLFVAYIMTVFIAGQGIVIFLLYVPFSKHVSTITITVTKLLLGKRSIFKMVGNETS